MCSTEVVVCRMWIGWINIDLFCCVVIPEGEEINGHPFIVIVVCGYKAVGGTVCAPVFYSEYSTGELSVDVCTLNEEVSSHMRFVVCEGELREDERDMCASGERRSIEVDEPSSSRIDVTLA